VVILYLNGLEDNIKQTIQPFPISK